MCVCVCVCLGREGEEEEEKKEILPLKGTKSEDSSVVKHLPANLGHASSIPGSGSSPGIGNGNPF